MDRKTATELIIQKIISKNVKYQELADAVGQDDRQKESRNQVIRGRG
jgi:hypothetical protein